MHIEQHEKIVGLLGNSTSLEDNCKAWKDANITQGYDESRTFPRPQIKDFPK